MHPVPTADKARAVQHYQALAAEAAALPVDPAALPTPPRLPTCIPVEYLDQAGRLCLAYPRSPWNPARYMVVRMGSRPYYSAATDLECVHDDFGNLVPLRERQLTGDFWSLAAWKPVTRDAAAEPPPPCATAQAA